MDCVYMYAYMWMYVSASFLLCTYTGLLCGYTLVHIYRAYTCVGQSKLWIQLTFSLFTVAIQKHSN